MKLEPLANSRIAEILLVDDNEDDVFLTREAFDAASLRVNLQHVDNGEKCLQYLRKQGPYAGASTPDLILLDMHMPVMDGYEVLSEIVKDVKLHHLPVVVLSTSYEAADIHKMYGLRCSSYITKPVDFESFVKAISQLAGYWLTVVVVPGAGGSHGS
ncbi:MAG: response regulator [Polaromonas sp.]|uniref:response regulator n=1 Tax=Polaromonas sp. TaxID=1869339 RepID=UPI0027316776|nr:response regulator [Polaromonas sp.]MDP1740886.1 response regulator [Polaromonas sp.]MDP1954756.1 response regulator [Polaromonas sp.]